MFDIDKERLGAFIAELRKEKGYTQKELADKLFLSNKAVSKWETGASIPDTTLLIPLAEILGVSVTELLTYQRIAPSTPIDSNQVEDLVKAAITYTEEEQSKIFHNRRQWIFIYFLCLFLCLAEIILLYLGSQFHIDYFIFIGMSVFFGAYFCIFAKPKLPTYYDENKINIYSDGIFRMNVPGVSFNNSNWPHVLQAIRCWSVISMAGYPILCFLTAILLPDELWRIGSYGILILYLAGLFIPVYHAGRKYQ